MQVEYLKKNSNKNIGEIRDHTGKVFFWINKICIFGDLCNIGKFSYKCTSISVQRVSVLKFFLLHFLPLLGLPYFKRRKPDETNMPSGNASGFCPIALGSSPAVSPACG